MISFYRAKPFPSNRLPLNQLNKAVGLNIRNARKSTRLDQRKFGELIGLSRTSMVNLEKGRQSVSLFKLNQISELTGYPLESFFKSYGWRIKRSMGDELKGIEQNLNDRIASIIEHHPNDEVANGIMKILRKQDPTYHWCSEMDEAVERRVDNENECRWCGLKYDQ